MLFCGRYIKAMVYSATGNPGGDGDMDLAFSGRMGAVDGAIVVRYLLNNADGTFNEPFNVSLAAGDTAPRIDISGFDRSGVEDVAVTNPTVVLFMAPGAVVDHAESFAEQSGRPGVPAADGAQSLIGGDPDRRSRTAAYVGPDPAKPDVSRLGQYRV